MSAFSVLLARLWGHAEDADEHARGSAGANRSCAYHCGGDLIRFAEVRRPKPCLILFSREGDRTRMPEPDDDQRDDPSHWALYSSDALRELLKSLERMENDVPLAVAAVRAVLARRELESKDPPRQP
ncbi:MAG: hypothetical protein QOH15_2488 [Gaiellales bacterium]|nr:hypothetical protein [Gaiellales bacterium]